MKTLDVVGFESLLLTNSLVVLEHFFTVFAPELLDSLVAIGTK